MINFEIKLENEIDIYSKSDVFEQRLLSYVIMVIVA
ncbi:hypothetical protein XIS1_260001 [Xenorhabdus innexi]|uniref:Uncharacterized protein n=1 Tax=Xenorhabdus innexi TaxID=290109 RepID=A0A1N6MXC0_9GAMM|nr:hypothetical protein XIS1_260001 [Xenorhabdus innexi]